jgi:hypothetical protein
MFERCVSLTDVDLSLPQATSCVEMFVACSSLTSVTLNLPQLVEYDSMFLGCSALETIDVTIPSDKVSGFKTYVLGLNLGNLTSFKINGEEQID